MSKAVSHFSVHSATRLEKILFIARPTVIYWNIFGPKKNCRSIDVNTQTDKLRDRQWVIEIFFQAQFNYKFVLWTRISLFQRISFQVSNLSNSHGKHVFRLIFWNANVHLPAFLKQNIVDSAVKNNQSPGEVLSFKFLRRFI